MGQLACNDLGCSSTACGLLTTAGWIVSPMKTSNFDSTWWSLQRISFKVVLADTVVEPPLRLPWPVVSWVWQVHECVLQDPVFTTIYADTRKCWNLVPWIWAPSARRKCGWSKLCLEGGSTSAQEPIWCGGISQNRIFTRKNSCYKFLWTGNKERKGSVGILLTEC